MILLIVMIIIYYNKHEQYKYSNEYGCDEHDVHVDVASFVITHQYHHVSHF